MIEFKAFWGEKRNNRFTHIDESKTEIPAEIHRVGKPSIVISPSNVLKIWGDVTLEGETIKINGVEKTLEAVGTRFFVQLTRKEVSNILASKERLDLSAKSKKILGPAPVLLTTLAAEDPDIEPEIIKDLRTPAETARVRYKEHVYGTPQFNYLVSLARYVRYFRRTGEAKLEREIKKSVDNTRIWLIGWRHWLSWFKENQLTEAKYSEINGVDLNSKNVVKRKDGSTVTTNWRDIYNSEARWYPYFIRSIEGKVDDMHERYMDFIEALEKHNGNYVDAIKEDIILAISTTGLVAREDFNNRDDGVVWFEDPVTKELFHTKHLTYNTSLSYYYRVNLNRHTRDWRKNPLYDLGYSILSLTSSFRYPSQVMASQSQVWAEMKTFLNEHATSPDPGYPSGKP